MAANAEERRRDERKPTLLGGRVVFNEHQSTMNCRIRNMSGGGARLRFDGLPILPQHFELRIEQRDEKRPAHRVWVTAREMGIAFD